MSSLLLFEQKHRGHMWRLEITTYKGRSFGNWRKWYLCDAEWRPTREGCIIPLERLTELTLALESHSIQSAIKSPDRA